MELDPVTRTFDAGSRAGESNADWCRRFYDAFFVTPGEDPVLFWKPDEEIMYLVSGGGPPRPIFNERQFAGEIANVINVVRPREAGTQTILPRYNLTRDEVPLLFYSNHQRNLPPLGSVIFEPALIFDSTGHPTISPTGYDALSRVYYWKDPVRASIRPKSSFEHLTKCFSGVPFEQPAYKANVMASLLGAIVLEKRFENPLLCVTGNQPGVGKTKLSASIGFILTGHEPSPVSFRGEEMVKEIGARFREHQRFILIDNVVGPGPGKAYKNDRLAVFLTQGHSKRVRELGFSRSIGQEGVLFTLTANNCELEQDLLVRSLMVRLYRELSAPMVPYVFDYARDHREDILGEILGLGLQDDLVPIADLHSPYFRFRNWLKFCWPRIYPHFGPMALLEVAEMDDAVLDFYTFAYDVVKKNKDYIFTVATLLDFTEGALGNGYRTEGIKSRIEHCRSRRGKETVLGIFVRSLIGKVISPIRGVFMKALYKRERSPIEFIFELQEHSEDPIEGEIIPTKNPIPYDVIPGKEAT